MEGKKVGREEWSAPTSLLPDATGSVLCMDGPALTRTQLVRFSWN